MNGFEIGLDGRYYISLWVVLQLLILLWPLPHRRHVRLRMAVGGLVLLLIGRGLLLLQSYVISVPLLIRTLMGAAAALLALFCCQVRPLQAAYAAIWATMTQQTLQNASSVLLNLLREAPIPLLGSDCHNLTTRPPNLKEGRKIVIQKLGSAFLDKMDGNAADLTRQTTDATT